MHVCPFFGNVSVAALFVGCLPLPTEGAFLMKGRCDTAMANQAKRAEAILLLQQMQRTLTDAGEDRYPRRGDFPQEQAAAIKAQLGPWPRALEAAGLKPERTDTRHRKTMKKRLQTKAENHGDAENAPTTENGGKES